MARILYLRQKTRKKFRRFSVWLFTVLFLAWAVSYVGAAFNSYLDLSQMLNLKRITVLKRDKTGRIRTYVGDIERGMGWRDDGRQYKLKGYEKRGRDLQIEVETR